MRGVVAAGHPLTARGRGGCAARRRQRGRRGGGRGADVVRGRVAAHGAGRGRLHGGPRRRRVARARLLRGRARAGARRTRARPRSCRSTCASPRTRSSASTSGPRRAARTAPRSGWRRRSGASARVSLGDLTARAGAGRARGRRGRADAGVPVHGARARSSRSTPECAAIYAPGRAPARARARRSALPELGDLLERLGARGARTSSTPATWRARVERLGARARRAC